MHPPTEQRLWMRCVHPHLATRTFASEVARPRHRRGNGAANSDRPSRSPGSGDSLAEEAMVVEGVALADPSPRFGAGMPLHAINRLHASIRHHTRCPHASLIGSILGSGGLWCQPCVRHLPGSASSLLPKRALGRCHMVRPGFQGGDFRWASG